ncbi:putative beaten path Ic-like, partial [Homarus americanus]
LLGKCECRQQWWSDGLVTVNSCWGSVSVVNSGRVTGSDRQQLLGMMVVASVLVHLIIGCVMGVSVGVRMKALEGPRYVVEGGNVSLTCSNVTTRPLAWFPIQGVQAQLGPEGEPEQVWLLEVGQEAAGVYTCEVTTEAPPTFLTANASITLHVVAPLSGSPVLRGTAGVVSEGEWVAGHCESPPATPTPRISFYVNHTPVVKEFMSEVTVQNTVNNKQVVSRSVGFSAHRRLFIKGHLLLECRVSIEKLVWRATTDLVLEGNIVKNRATGVRSQGYNEWLLGTVALLVRWCY